MRIPIPSYAKSAARLGLKKRASLPKSKKSGLTKSEASRMGISSGVERAKQIINNSTLSEQDARSVGRFYARFRNQRSQKAENALLLWGGRKFGMQMWNMFRKKGAVRKINYQNKASTKQNTAKDSKLRALPPGTRVSKNGKVYREYRANRSDYQKRKKPFL